MYSLTHMLILHVAFNNNMILQCCFIAYTYMLLVIFYHYQDFKADRPTCNVAKFRKSKNYTTIFSYILEFHEDPAVFLIIS